MLEPETDDNVVYWNTMDAWIPRPGEEAQGDRDEEDVGPPRGGPPGGFPQGFGGQRQEQGPPVVPIFKLMAPTPLSTRLLDKGH